jgi:hypothetical protein
MEEKRDKKKKWKEKKKVEKKICWLEKDKD